MADESDIKRVTVVDIRIPFFSMVILLVKLSIAAIPALIILSLIFTLTIILLSVTGELFWPEATQIWYGFSHQQP
jgi:hypothetical protein